MKFNVLLIQLEIYAHIKMDLVKLKHVIILQAILILKVNVNNGYLMFVLQKILINVKILLVKHIYMLQIMNVKIKCQHVQQMEKNVYKEVNAKKHMHKLDVHYQMMEYNVIGMVKFVKINYVQL